MKINTFNIVFLLKDTGISLTKGVVEQDMVISDFWWNHKFPFVYKQIQGSLEGESSNYWVWGHLLLFHPCIPYWKQYIKDINVHVWLSYVRLTLEI